MYPKCRGLHCKNDATKRLKFSFVAEIRGEKETLFVLNKELCDNCSSVLLSLLDEQGLDATQVASLTRKMIEAGYQVDVSSVQWEMVPIEWVPDPLVTEEIQPTQPAPAPQCGWPLACPNPPVSKILLKVPVRWANGMAVAFIEGVAFCNEHVQAGMSYNVTDLKLALEHIVRRGGVPLVEGLVMEAVPLDWTPPTKEQVPISDLRAEEEIRMRRMRNARNN